MKRPSRPKQILLSKRANILYLEHARVVQKNGRVLYLTDSGADVESYFNVPHRNTSLLLLGQGTSVTSSAARLLAEENVIVGFCGSGGSPLFSAMDAVFLSGTSEYRPTEYMQEWMRMWLDEERRLAGAKTLMRQRARWVDEAWKANGSLGDASHRTLKAGLRTLEKQTAAASDTETLLGSEAVFARRLYRVLADEFDIKDWKREAGEPGDGDTKSVVNSLLDHGNYVAYGLASVALHALGISFALPLLHGKTRRGALVFDVADLFKDAIVMPLAFEIGQHGDARKADKKFRAALIDRCHADDVVERVIETLRVTPSGAI